MALADDLSAAVDTLVNKLDADHKARAQFVADVAALVEQHGSPLLQTQIAAAIAKLNAAGAQVDADAAASAAEDAAVTATTNPPGAGSISPSLTGSLAGDAGGTGSSSTSSTPQAITPEPASVAAGA